MLHGFRVACTPVMVLIGFRLPTLISGSIVIENIFQWPGVGVWFTDAIKTQNTPIMIFDDSLSAVDTQTDAKIRQAIAQRFGKASVILISHRITTLSSADKIIVLDRGRIVEEGTHEKLKCAGGIYQKIYETQTGGREVSAP